MRASSPSAMAVTVVADVSPDLPPSFDGRCVGCGAPAATTSTLAIQKLVPNARGTQEAHGVKWPVPHCAACAALTTSTFLAAFVPFAIGFLVAGGLAFAVVGLKVLAIGLDDGTPSPRTPASLVLGALAGLVAGLAGGFVLELAARIVLTPWFGRALWRLPLLVPSFFTDGDAVVGLAGTPNADVTVITLRFDRDDAAEAFLAANPTARREADRLRG